jgi:chromosome segregation protein
MYIDRLRLIGFKSFVETAELIVQDGLTGVVGPNGCGKSNLLEALRWVMGETSHKSMRASAMEDVIFNGTNDRPPRNTAEVTIFIDNRNRRAPAEFNDADALEVTRRIERDAGSAYRINGKEVRARDVRILFEDAATGARSPALVRQGQIGEIVNAKPDQRRRILEDAAGVAGLHSRRHEAELRLRAAETNLARVRDILSQLKGQLEALRRQARQARRYKELSAEIRKCEALVLHLGFTEAQQRVDAEEQNLLAALARVGRATSAEAQAVLEEAAAGERVEPVREAEAVKAAALHRLALERERLEREAERCAERERELKARLEQLGRDAEREAQLVAEAQATLAQLERESEALATTGRLASDVEQKALANFDAATAALAAAEARLAQLTTRVAQQRAHVQSLLAERAARREERAKLEHRLAALEAETREIISRAPDAAKLKAAHELGQRLLAEIAATETHMLTAEDAVQAAHKAAEAAGDAARESGLLAGQLTTEMETLAKLLAPRPQGHPAVLDEVRVDPGYEMALAAALGDDLEAPAGLTAPAHWRHIAAPTADPPLPRGVERLAVHVDAPPVLSRRLNQIGIVAAADGQRLQAILRSGQRLVSRAGDLWRWDGYVASAATAAAAATRLAERSRLGALSAAQSKALHAARAAQSNAAAASERHRVRQGEERRLRQLWRERQAALAQVRELITTMERQARETESKMAAVADARSRASEALGDVTGKLETVERALAEAGGFEALEAELAGAQEETARLRAEAGEGRAELITLEREHRARSERQAAIGVESERWRARSAAGDAQIATLAARREEIAGEVAKLAELPAKIEAQRGRLMGEVANAEAARRAAADALSLAVAAQRDAGNALRAAQAELADEREARARTEARLEAARSHRGEQARKIQDQLGVAPDACLQLAELAQGAAPPDLARAEADLTRLKGERERLGPVNLQADEDLNALSEQCASMDGEQRDVDGAIAKLRAGIAQINAEGQARLKAAFDSVNAHFAHLFHVLFGGGEARLELVEAEDPLENGLEIIARPPGKKPALLSLLSGGEQSLTALALIFAVFLTNPAPICVLDEVDAPLDDANVDRFCTLMEKMASDTATRFLVITHHPMTMARMHRLFGVTMGEKGVSQLVSVDLETAQKFTAAA